MLQFLSGNIFNMIDSDTVLQINAKARAMGLPEVFEFKLNPPFLDFCQNVRTTNAPRFVFRWFPPSLKLAEIYVQYVVNETEPLYDQILGHFLPGQEENWPVEYASPEVTIRL